MRRRGKLSNKQWTLWTEMLISAWPISVMPLKCSGGIRVLTDSTLPSLFIVSLQSHRWVLWACDSWRLISRQPAAVQIHAWMFSSPAPPATVVLEAPLPNGCYKHISNEPMPVAAGHFTGYTQNEAQAPCATALLPAGQPSLRCSHPRSLCSLFP